MYTALGDHFPLGVEDVSQSEAAASITAIAKALWEHSERSIPWAQSFSRIRLAVALSTPGRVRIISLITWNSSFRL